MKKTKAKIAMGIVRKLALEFIRLGILIYEEQELGQILTLKDEQSLKDLRSLRDKLLEETENEKEISIS